MKRVLTLVLAVTLLLCGCGKKQPEPQKQEENTAPTGLVLNNVTIQVGEELTATQKEALGQPSEIQEFPSCISGATDHKYIYSEFTLQAYPQDDAEILQIVELLTNTYATEKGIKVGDTTEAVKEAYGEPDLEEKFYMDYNLTDTIVLSFELKDGVVTKIVYTDNIE